MRIYYQKLRSMAHAPSLSIFIAFKGTHFYIFMSQEAAQVILYGSIQHALIIIKDPQQYILYKWNPDRTMPGRSTMIHIEAQPHYNHSPALKERDFTEFALCLLVLIILVRISFYVNR